MDTQEKQKNRPPKLVDRKTLYERFEKGMRPSADDFKRLIYSTINKLDDGISKSFKHGLKLSPQRKLKENGEVGDVGEDVISFYEEINGDYPLWTISLSKENLFIKTGKDDKALLTLTPEGNVGIMNPDPKYTLDVEGSVGMKTRLGTYEKGTIKANGQWQTILSELKGSTMFEIVALAQGRESGGTHSFLHAVASNAFARNARSIKFTRTHDAWWKWWKRIGLKWEGTSGNYSLKMKTNGNYGDGSVIKYRITNLWLDNDFD